MGISPYYPLHIKCGLAFLLKLCDITSIVKFSVRSDESSLTGTDTSTSTMVEIVGGVGAYSRPHRPPLGDYRGFTS